MFVLLFPKSEDQKITGSYRHIGPWLTPDDNFLLSLTYSDKHKFSTEVENCSRLYQYTLPRLFRFYQTCLNSSVTMREVEILTYRVITTLLKDFVGYYYMMKKLSELDHSAYRLITLKKNDYQIPNSDRQFDEFIRNDHLFSAQIFSCINSVMRLPFVEGNQVTLGKTIFAYRHATEKREFRQNVFRSFITLKRFLTRGDKLEAAKNVSFTYKVPDEITARLVDGDVPQVWKVPAFMGFHYFRSDKKLRGQLRLFLGDQQSSPMESAFAEALTWALPRCYVEGFAKNKHYAMRLSEKIAHSPKVIIADRLYFVHERYLLNELLKKGSRFYMIQHGGVYGDAKLPPWQEGETSISDKFLTWGWSETEKHVPGLAFSIVKYKPGPNRGEKLLWLTRETTDRPGVYYLRFFDNNVSQEKFFRLLLPSVRQRTTLRINRKPNTQEFRQSTWRHRYPELHVDFKSIPFLQRLQEAQLVVIDYFFSTVFPECILLDKPVIMFEDKNEPACSPIAESVYAQMRACGIVHTSAEDAADFINSNFENIQSWWESPNVKAAVSSYRNSFVNNNIDEKLLQKLFHNNSL
jgi:putative transferase (TIGR04331 family)